MKALILCLFIVLASSGCGPGAALQPLVGETVDITDQMETSPDVLTRRAPDLAAQSMLKAISDGDDTTTLKHLSNKTKKSLQTLFSGGPSDDEILKGLAAYRASGKSLVTLLFGVPGAKVAASSPRQIARGLQVPHSIKAKVRLISAEKTEHWCFFTLEDNTWKLQRTKFDQIL